MEERKGVTWNVNHPVQHPVLQFRASSFKRNKLLFLPEGSIASFVSVSIAIVNTMFTRESMFPSPRMREGKKITPKMTDANGWNAWLSISARKLRFDDEREGKKTIEKDACQIANMHMQHHARSLIIRMLYRSTEHHRALFVPEKCCFTSYTAQTSIHRSGTRHVRASTKPSRLSPVAVTHR